MFWTPYSAILHRNSVRGLSKTTSPNLVRERPSTMSLTSYSTTTMSPSCPKIQLPSVTNSHAKNTLLLRSTGSNTIPMLNFGWFFWNQKQVT